MTQWLVAGALVVAAVVALGIWVTARRQTAPIAPVALPAVPFALQKAASSVFDMGELVQDSPPGSIPVTLQDLGDGQFLAIGPDRAIEALDPGATQGTSRVPSQLARMVLGASSAVDSARVGAEMSGRLVILSKESAAALKAGKAMKGVGGYVRAIAVDPKSQQITKILQIKPATLLSTGLAASNLLAGIATQIQMAQIEQALARIEDAVREVNAEQVASRQAVIDSATEDLLRVYGEATRSGELTLAQWVEIAQLRHHLDTRWRESLSAIERRTTTAKGGAGARRDHAKKISIAATAECERAVAAARALIQWDLLRLWHLSSVADPNLMPAQQDLPERLEKMLRTTDQAIARLEASLDGIEELSKIREVTGHFQKTPMRYWVGQARTAVGNARLDQQLLEIPARMRANGVPAIQSGAQPRTEGGETA